VAYTPRSRDEHFDKATGPKRILALDGGGLRGILTLGILKQIEDELRQRHGGAAGFRLCHYFDLIAGTSTGAIIAAALAIGMSVEDITKKYFALGSRVFKRSLLRQGWYRAKYDDELLIKELKAVFGADTTLGSKDVLTGLLIVIKRLDTVSPWPVSNNPKGKYFASREGGTIGNGDYPLWQTVRASTAAPDYFDPERITIAQLPDHVPVYGDFVDGGVSPFNNPALQAVMYSTIKGYRIEWETGPEKLFVVSVGTGTLDKEVRKSAAAGIHAVRSLLSLMDDCAALQETLLQWMSASPTAREIDRELGKLDGDLVGGMQHMSYLRYNALLDAKSITSLLGEKEAVTIPMTDLSAMDAPENMNALHKIGVAAGKRDVLSAHFPQAFNLG